MGRLNLFPNVAAPDDLYDRLSRMHEGRTVEDSLKLMARLILVLANHVGDAGVLDEAIALAARQPARDGAAPPDAGT